MQPEPGLRRDTLAWGVLLGALAAFCNLVVSLKTGWALPVMTSTAIIGIAMPTTHGTKRAPRDLVAMAAIASAAGYMAGGGNAAAIAVLTMLTGAVHAPFAMAGWFLSTALLGTLLAPLIGQRLIATRIFPTASAAATLARDGEARSSLHPLVGSVVTGALSALLRFWLRVPSVVALPGWFGRHAFGFDTSLLLVGTGALIPVRTSLASLFGAILTYGAIGPRLHDARVVNDLSYPEVVRFMVWPAAALLVSSSICDLVLQRPRSMLAHVNATRRGWVFAGLAGAVSAWLEWRLFSVPLLAAVLSVPLALLMAAVAGRTMGETDIVPTKALAPLTQLGIGAVSPSTSAITIAPNLTSAVALHAADTMGSLKMAKLLSVKTVTVLFARAIGCAVGAAVVAFAYVHLVPDANKLPTTEMPAPGVLVWKSVVEVTRAHSWPPSVRIAAWIGALLGVVLTVLRHALPAGAARFVPSPMGLGSGMVLPAASSLALALGSLLRHFYEARGTPARRSMRARSAIIVAIGLIAAESVVSTIAQLFSG